MIGRVCVEASGWAFSKGWKTLCMLLDSLARRYWILESSMQHDVDL